MMQKKKFVSQKVINFFPERRMYSEPCQTSKIERFAKIVMGKDSITLEIIWFFDDFRRRGGVEIN